jgi:hypothetical protein
MRRCRGTGAGDSVIVRAPAVIAVGCLTMAHPTKKYRFTSQLLI